MHCLQYVGLMMIKEVNRNFFLKNNKKFSDLQFSHLFRLYCRFQIWFSNTFFAICSFLCSDDNGIKEENFCSPPQSSSNKGFKGFANYSFVFKNNGKYDVIQKYILKTFLRIAEKLFILNFLTFQNQYFFGEKTKIILVFL